MPHPNQLIPMNQMNPQQPSKPQRVPFLEEPSKRATTINNNNIVININKNYNVSIHTLTSFHRQQLSLNRWMKNLWNKNTCKMKMRIITRNPSDTKWRHPWREGMGVRGLKILWWEVLILLSSREANTCQRWIWYRIQVASPLRKVYLSSFD